VEEEAAAVEVDEVVHKDPDKKGRVLWVVSHNLVCMNTVNMPFQSSLLTKTLLTNVALMWFEIFMNTLHVFSYIIAVERRILTQMTFVFLLVFVNHLCMALKH
jgi:hypothetical protein